MKRLQFAIPIAWLPDLVEVVVVVETVPASPDYQFNFPNSGRKDQEEGRTGTAYNFQQTLPSLGPEAGRDSSGGAHTFHPPGWASH